MSDWMPIETAQNRLNALRAEMIAICATTPSVGEAESLARRLEAIAARLDCEEVKAAVEEAAELLRDQDRKIDGLYDEIRYGDDY